MPTDVPAFDDPPQSLADLKARFSTDDECLRYLYSVQWPRGFWCKYCVKPRFMDGELHRTRYGVLQCSNSKHHHTAILADSVMRKSKQPLTNWFLAAYLVAIDYPGISGTKLQQMFGANGHGMDPGTPKRMIENLRTGLFEGNEPLSHRVWLTFTTLGEVPPDWSRQSALSACQIMLAMEVNADVESGTEANIAAAGVRSDEGDRGQRANLEPSGERQSIRPARIRLFVLEEKAFLHWMARNVSPTWVDPEGTAHPTVLCAGEGEWFERLRSGGWHTEASDEHTPGAHDVLVLLKRWLDRADAHHPIGKKALPAVLRTFGYRYCNASWREDSIDRALGLRPCALLEDGRVDRLPRPSRLRPSHYPEAVDDLLGPDD